MHLTVFLLFHCITRRSFDLPLTCHRITMLVERTSLSFWSFDWLCRATDGAGTVESLSSRSTSYYPQLWKKLWIMMAFSFSTCIWDF